MQPPYPYRRTTTVKTIMEDIIKSLGVTVNDEPTLVVTHKKKTDQKKILMYVCIRFILFVVVAVVVVVVVVRIDFFISFTFFQQFDFSDFIHYKS